MHSGWVLLAPLPGECKGSLDDTHNAAAASAHGPVPRNSITTQRPTMPLRIALYQPDIPQNTGTVLRLCACLGIEAHIIEPAGFPTSDRAFRRAGMDYLDAVDIVRHASWRDFEAWRQSEALSPRAVDDEGDPLLSRLQL